MKKINIKLLFSLTALVVLIFLLSTPVSKIPPLGKLLDPFIGILQNEEDQRLDIPQLILSKTGTTKPVHVFFDHRKVPHIYAENDADLYFTQGYVTAALRLWQMDFISYVSAGRLSEIFRDGFLDYDRQQRRIGILEAAEASLKMIMQDPETNKIIIAYTCGVNAYIRTLSYKTLPLEYKLLDYEPEPWTALKTVLIMKYMGNTLSGYEEDYLMTHMRLAIGEAPFHKFFPDFNAHSTPIVPDEKPGQLAPLQVTRDHEYIDSSYLLTCSQAPQNKHNPMLGSNSWAVSGMKTVSGFPMLCSDPHLNLSLPAIWIEMQLVTPGMNVYGVAIPGTPAVIIGFNENIAWGLSNGCDDVKDWYKLKLTKDYRKYELDGKWLDVNTSVETIKRKGQSPFYDTIYHTIQGPITYSKSFPGSTPALVDHALRWELHRPSNEFLCFIKLSRAMNYLGYKDAIRHYASPVQNFTFACKDNTIAVTHQGSMAVKWPEQGKFVLDGSKGAHLYRDYISEDSLPHLLNPACNYVVSANQHPTSASYPYYYNGYFRENRANRIKQLLENENSFDIPKMEQMQLDNKSVFAVDAMPVLLQLIDKENLTTANRKMLEMLAAWDGAYNLDDKSAFLFELWWKQVKTLTWDEFSNAAFGKKVPDDYILLDLIQQEPANTYFDKQGTPAREQAADIIREAFSIAVADYNKQKSKEGVRWGDVNKVNVMYMGSLDAFSRRGLSAAGNPEAINAMSGGWGPSWRMVVALGERPKAFGIYAGGQSGNTGSRYFDDFVNDWNKGNYYPLTFFMSMKEAKEKTNSSWLLK